MPKGLNGIVHPPVEDVFEAAPTDTAVPIHLVRSADGVSAVPGLDSRSRAWLEASGFQSSTSRKQALVPGADGSISAVALSVGNGRSGDPCGPSELLVGQLASSVPAGIYKLENEEADITLAAIAWGLGAYRFRRYKTAAAADKAARLVVPKSVDARSVKSIVEAIWLGRDLINTPASDLGPEELEQEVRELAARHGAEVAVTSGEALLAQNFPMIHAVGRASSRAPRLIDLTWSKPDCRADAPRVTLVGKGICFDTGGLDIKPSSGMLLMKKDMGGAATAMALGHMIMAHGLDVRLRILIPAAENSISGDAFRPSDVLVSRAGLMVEVGNTDAEGRLVLADALSLADEESPDTLLCFATLTGACRVALGAELPGLFCDDDALARDVEAAGLAIGDPLWRLPMWPGYDRNLDSDVADLGNVSDGPFAGAITAALFLKRFVRKARQFAHVDLYGWRPAARPLGPKGGEPQSARAMFRVLSARYGG